MLVTKLSVLSAKSSVLVTMSSVLSAKPSLLSAKPSVLSTKPSVLATTPSVLATKLSVLSTKPLNHQLKFYEVIKHTLHGGLRRLGFSLDDIAPLDKNGFLHESQGLASKRISPSKNPQFSHYRRERGGSSHRLRWDFLERMFFLFKLASYWNSWMFVFCGTDRLRKFSGVGRIDLIVCGRCFQNGPWDFYLWFVISQLLRTQTPTKKGCTAIRIHHRWQGTQQSEFITASNHRRQGDFSAITL